MAKADANLMRPGWVIEYNGRPHTVMGISIVKPGKGGAFIQADLRDLDSGSKTNHRWRTVDTVEKLLAEDKDFSFLYSEGDSAVFMDSKTYDQLNVANDVIGEERAKLLADGMNVVISFVEGRPVGVRLPKNTIVVLTDTEAVVKGQTATSSFKPATTEQGIRVMVPQFIEAGEAVVISTDDMSYIERAKK
ncbi:MAG: elongation factor P [Alphaproteobacteria bacterium]|nr:elongation factor P [Alphaproteobacteria bacterium]